MKDRYTFDYSITANTIVVHVWDNLKSDVPLFGHHHFTYSLKKAIDGKNACRMALADLAKLES